MATTALSRSVVQGYFRGGSPSIPAPAWPAVQRRAAGAPVSARPGGPEAYPLPPALSRSFGGGAGAALPEPVRRQMESYFGASFAEVRVHVGPQAPAIGALAFTRGSDLFFAPGHYDPASAQGRRLIGHELAHVVQQRAGRVLNPFGAGLAVVVDRQLEAEAERRGLAAADHRPPAARAAPAAPSRAKAGAPKREPSASLQPMSFARFSTYGFLSNWGSYSAEENQLLALETQVNNFYDRLPFLAKKRERVRLLKKRLDDISASTLAETKYKATKKSLEEIEEALELERRRQFLASNAYPENPVLASIYSGGINDEAWKNIVTGISHKERGNLIKGLRSHKLVDELFISFCRQGFRYRTFGGATNVLGNDRGPHPEGSCLGLARAFADVLNAYEIEAEARTVRDEEDGKRFIVKLPKFIDGNVPGHIFHSGGLKKGYYMFSSHTAVWVESKQCFYDPMAVAIYSKLDQYIDCELTTDQGETEFVPIGTPKTLCPSFKWKLVRPQAPFLAGGFVRLNLVRDDG